MRVPGASARSTDGSHLTRVRRVLRAACVAAMLLPVGPPLASAQEESPEPPFRLEPAWLYSAETRKAAAGLRARAGFDRNSALGGLSAWQKGYAFDASAAVTTESRFNPERMEAGFRAGFLRDVEYGTVAEPAPGSLEPPADDRTTVGSFDAGVDARFESDQRFDEPRVSASLQTGFVRNTTHGAWRLLPSLRLRLDWVHPVGSEVRDALALDPDPFGRFQLEAYTKLSLPAEGPPRWMLPLFVFVNYRWVELLGDQDAALLEEFESVDYFAADLGYEMPHGVLPWVRDVYVRYTHGSLAPSPDAGDAVRFGVTMAPKAGP